MGISKGLNKGNAVSVGKPTHLSSLNRHADRLQPDRDCSARTARRGLQASHLRCPFPDLPPMVGFAETATIRARDPVSGPSYMQKRMDYLDYVAATPRPTSW